MKPIFDVFREAMLANATGSRKDAQDEFVARMKASPAYFDALARDYFDRMAAVWTVRPEGNANTFTRTEASADKVARMSGPRPALVPRSREESVQRTAKAFEDLKAKVRSVVLLDLMLPNGTALRDATGAECAKAGGFFSEVAKHLKPSQVVDRHLKERDLQNIRARFYQANKLAS